MTNDLILAIDTSCDDTAAAVTRGRVVYANVVASQVELHKKFGGVFPTIAKQAHRQRIAPVVALALERAGVTWSAVARIAVTQGPGLAPALEVGLEYAKQLAITHQLPLTPVNHIAGHIFAVAARPRPRLDATLAVAGLPSSPLSPTTVDSQLPLRWPILAVIVSGGHTEFVLVTGPDQYQRVGWTVDDAAGEALDKFGRMVDLGYPAGPVVELLARQGNPRAFTFPLPMTTTHDAMMSFSGLKTAVRRKVEELTAHQPLTKEQVVDLCASFQYAVFHAICYKLNKFLQHYLTTGQPPLQAVWLGGGVAANVALRQHLRQTLRPYQLPLHTPYTKKLCSDNAAMIGVAAAVRPVSPGNAATWVPDRLPQWRVDQS